MDHSAFQLVGPDASRLHGPMEKRYQVFVSSTFSDLAEARRGVINILMQMDHIPAVMEFFPAIDLEQWAFIKRIIDDCDYYILIVGGRYGSTTAEGISFTEMEYDYAVSRDIPVIALLHGNPDEIPIGKSEIDTEAREKLAVFREKVRGGRLIRPWTTIAELPALVAVNLPWAIKSFPRPGWVRGGTTSNPELLEQLNALRIRNDELQDSLAMAMADRRPHESLDLVSVDSKYRLSGKFGVHSRECVHEWAAEMTWNEIMGLLGPHLMQPLYEDGAQYHLAKSILESQGKTTVTSCTIETRLFETVKLQLLALNYIEIQSLANRQGLMTIYWSNTQRGAEVMLRMRTVQNCAAQS